MSQIMLPAHISNPSMVSLNKRNQHSLLSQQDAEIQGFYWPRVLIRPTEKKEDKKACKVKRKTKAFLSSTKLSPKAGPLAPVAAGTSLLELLRDIPALVSEDVPSTAAASSPITGKPILSPKIKKSILIPTKPVRKQLLRRSQSNSTNYSLD